MQSLISSPLRIEAQRVICCTLAATAAAVRMARKYMPLGIRDSLLTSISLLGTMCLQASLQSKEHALAMLNSPETAPCL